MEPGHRAGQDPPLEPGAEDDVRLTLEEGFQELWCFLEVVCAVCVCHDYVFAFCVPEGVYVGVAVAVLVWCDYFCSEASGYLGGGVCGVVWDYDFVC